MQRWSDAVLDPNGNAIRGATVTVTVTSSGAAASLFSVNGATAQDNPMTTGSDGEYYFYAANGRYTVTIEATGYATETKEVLLLDWDDETGVPVASAEWTDKECFPISAGITLETSDMAAGRTFSVYNDTSGSLTITQGSGVTLRLAGTGTTGNRTLAQRGLATVWCRSATEAVIVGSGVS